MYDKVRAVLLKYADVEAGTFAAYRLPDVPVPPLADKVEIAGKKYVKTKAEEQIKVNNTGTS